MSKASDRGASPQTGAASSDGRQDSDARTEEPGDTGADKNVKDPSKPNEPAGEQPDETEQRRPGTANAEAPEATTPVHLRGTPGDPNPPRDGKTGNQNEEDTSRPGERKLYGIGGNDSLVGFLAISGTAGSPGTKFPGRMVAFPVMPLFDEKQPHADLEKRLEGPGNWKGYAVMLPANGEPYLVARDEQDSDAPVGDGVEQPLAQEQRSA